MKTRHLIAASALLGSLLQTAFAGNISGLGNLSQSEFRTVSEDLGAAFSYKPLAPTTPLGLTGFDIGVEVFSTDMSRSTAILSKAGVSTDGMNNLYTPRVHLHKGLPLSLDIAAFIATVPGIGGQLVGGELRYALIDGGVAVPAVGLRAAATQLNGVDNLSVGTRSVDLSISKGFAVFTPYAGVGQVWVNSNPSAGSLASESFTQGKLFAGVNINLGLLNFAIETDKTGSTASWGVKMGWRW